MPERSSRRRAWLTAITASLLVHALALLLLAWLSSHPGPAPKPRPKAIRVTYRSPPPKPPAPPLAAPAAPPPPPKPRPPQRAMPSPDALARMPPAPPPAPAPPAPASPAATPPAATPPDATASPAPTDATASPAPADAPRAEAPAPTARLIPELHLPAAPAPLAAPPTGLQAPPVPKDLVGSLVVDTLARGKVDRGLVHPYYAEVGKALLKAWDAERAVTRKGLKGFLQQGQENTAAFGRIWMENAKAYGATGVPVQDAAVSDRLLPGVNDGLLAREAVRRQTREQFRATRRATVRVVQDRGGKLVEVTLVSPSNDAQADREALTDVRKAAESLPVPPPEALGTRETLVSLWQFELIISISPPVPSMSFEFDEVLKFADVRVPLDRRVYKRIRLLSAE